MTRIAGTTVVTTRRTQSPAAVAANDERMPEERKPARLTTTSSRHADEALWLVHWLNAKAEAEAANRGEQRRSVFVALVGMILALFALAGTMLWTAWR
jgi:hypothetical protein